jgi:hypothetical protein
MKVACSAKTQKKNRKMQEERGKGKEKKCVQAKKRCVSPCFLLLAPLSTTSSRDGSYNPHSALIIIPHRILVPSPTLEIPLKSERNIKHTADMHHAERLLLVDGEGLRSAHGILDLSSVEVVLGEVVEVCLAEGQRVCAFEDAHFLEEHLEDGLLGFGGELAVAEGDVDARLEGVVEGLGS